MASVEQFARDPSRGLERNDDHGNIDAGKKVGQVVIDQRDFAIAGAPFVIGGAEFMFPRLCTTSRSSLTNTEAGEK